MTTTTIKTLCIVAFLSILSFSQMAPFYPLQAKEKGITVFYVGFVLGSNAVAYMGGSIFSSNYLHLVGRENSMIVGMLLILIQ